MVRANLDPFWHMKCVPYQEQNGSMENGLHDGIKPKLSLWQSVVSVSCSFAIVGKTEDSRTSASTIFALIALR